MTKLYLGVVAILLLCTECNACCVLHKISENLLTLGGS